MTSFPLIADRCVVELGSVDIPRLADLCRACTAFYELVEGQAPTNETATKILGPLDPELRHGTKQVWGVEAQGDLVAVAELLQGHPTPNEWYIGLFLVTPRLRREGLGTRFCRMILDRISLGGGTTVRLVVQQQNVPAQLFWQKQGFSFERELKKKTGRLEGQVSVFARSLAGRKAS